jgi:hypothetical protein
VRALSEYVDKNGYQLNNKLQNIGDTLNSLKEDAKRNDAIEDYIVQQLPKVNHLFEYVQHMRNKINHSNEYLNHELVPKIVENLEEVFAAISSHLGVENYAKIIKKEETDITEQVDQILTIATKKKEQQVTNETLNFYVRQLDDEKQKQYHFLTESQRQKFVYHLNNLKPVNISELDMIWNKVVDKNSLVKDKENYLLEHMPNIVKSLYETLDPTSKQRLLAASNSYILDTPFKVQTF